MSQIQHEKTLVYLSSLQTITMNQYCCWKCMQINLHQLYMFNMALTRNKGIFLVLSLSLKNKSQHSYYNFTRIIVGRRYVCHLFFDKCNKWWFSIYPFNSSFFAAFRQPFQWYSTELNFNLSNHVCKNVLDYTKKTCACFNNFLNKLTQVSANLLNEFKTTNQKWKSMRNWSNCDDNH